ncbi:MAG: SPFH domain-containing protein [Parcubacteria group bacterium]|jgi:regulator of protease activity HflC (stomatin/prohibitin superfamily)
MWEMIDFMRSVWWTIKSWDWSLILVPLAIILIVIIKFKKIHPKEESDGEEENSMRANWIIRLVPTIVFSVLVSAGAIIGGLIGSYFDEAASAGIAGSILAAGFYIAHGYVQKPEKEVDVIETFGRFRRVAYPGPRILCLPGIIDKVKATVPYQVRLRRDLFTEELRKKLELQDVTVTIEGHIWYEVVDPIKWVYNYRDPVGHLEESFDNSVRPKFQALRSEEADTKRPDIVANSLSLLCDQLLEKTGAMVKDFYMPDFDYGEEGDKARLQKFQADKRMSANVTDAKGWTAAIEAIMESALKSGHPISWEEARNFYLDQRRLETLGKTGANVYAISGDLLGGLAGAIQSIENRFKNKGDKT